MELTIEEMGWIEERHASVGADALRRALTANGVSSQVIEIDKARTHVLRAEEWWHVRAEAKKKAAEDIDEFAEE